VRFLVSRASRTLGGTVFCDLFYLRQQRVASFERKYLAELLARRDGDVSGSARDACVPRGTFYRLMNRYKIDPQDFRQKSF
jgi:DNA-binding NtrC family response regulator